MLQLHLMRLLCDCLLYGLLLFLLDNVIQFVLILTMDKVTTGPVRTESNRMECTAQIRLVLRVPGQITQFMSTVRELTLIPVFTMSRLLEGTAHFSLVAARVDV